ncbi:MAG: alpha/beta fold hydrolase [bacterium]|nr:alpha/beta fold hydrolase [bacterium]
MKPLLLLGLVLAHLPSQVRAQTVGALYEPGERAVWTFELAQQPLGMHMLRYEGPADVFGARAHHFTAWVKLDATPRMPVEQRYRAELWTDDAGRPLRHVLQARIGKQDSRVELTFHGQRAAARVVQRGAARNLEVDVPDGSFLQTNNFIGWFEILLALHGPGSGAEPGAARKLPLFSSNVLRPVPYEVTRKPDVEQGGVTCVRLEDSLGETITIGPDGRLLELSVPAQSLIVTRGDADFEPFELETVARSRDERFTYEEVRIESAGAVLAGSVTKPRDAEGKLPAVFFISGSGLQDRDGFSSGIDLGTHEILDRLSAAGFLVLRVDDRGCGASTGELEGIGYDELVGDARACVAHLFGRADVDPRRVAVIGHSEGGVTAPILAAEEPRIAAIVLMAATGRPLIDVVMDQNRLALEEAGEASEETLAEVRALLERLSGDAEVDPDELPADQRGLLDNREWLRDHARQDPAANIARVHCPVLLLQGAKDFQVSAKRDAAVLKAVLDAAEHADHALRVFENLDHLFKPVAGEVSRLTDYFEERAVAEEFLVALVEWLEERLLAH